MNITEIFHRHFGQCKTEESEFSINGTPYRDKWPKAAGMPLFIKDLEEEALDEHSAHEEIVDALKAEITSLEHKLDELRHKEP